MKYQLIEWYSEGQFIYEVTDDLCKERLIWTNVTQIPIRNCTWFTHRQSYSPTDRSYKWISKEEAFAYIL